MTRVIPPTSQETALAICAVGMVCSVGLNARAACAAVRARIARFQEVSFFDSLGEPIVAAPAEQAAQGRQGYRRLGPLLNTALSDCIGGDRVAQSNVLKTVPCLVVIGHSDRPDYPPDLASFLLAHLRAEFGQDLHPETRVAYLGATGFFEAIRHSRLLTETNTCIVVAVDSLINGRMLSWLESQHRLKTQANSDGVIPGEAAAAIWLMSRRSVDRPALAYVVGLGLSDEPSARDASRPNKGIGLSQALRSALVEAGIPLLDVDFRVGGMTGERTGFVEAATALARIQKTHKDDFALWVPAEQIGDVGAALAACMTVVSAVALAKGYAPGPRGIVYCSSHREKRAACVLAAGLG